VVPSSSLLECERLLSELPWLMSRSKEDEARPRKQTKDAPGPRDTLPVGNCSKSVCSSVVHGTSTTIMGKRKKSSRKPMQAKKREPLGE
jgi:hypothetical protein